MKISKFVKTKEFMIKFSIAIALLAVLILSFFFSKQIERTLGLSVELFPSEVSSEEMKDAKYTVEYIDVGQGNSTFVVLPDGKTLLIDGGKTEYGKKVCDVISSYNVDKIDYLIATHADADHIGGLNVVLEKFEVKNIYRPFQIAGTGTNSQNFVVYEDEDLAEYYEYMVEKYNNKTKISRVSSDVYNSFITKIYSEYYTAGGDYEKSTVCVFYDGLKISGENYELEFFAPSIRSEDYDLSEYSNTLGFATNGYGVSDSNGNSAIFLLSIFNDTFLFTGDAPCSSGSSSATKKYEELDFINSLTNEELLKFKNISVYLAGHHGSKYSTSEKLLSLTTPRFNVISVGVDNSYGHPADETLERIKSIKSCEDYLLETRKFGSITFGRVSDGLVYTLELQTDSENLIVSWYLLGTCIYVFAVYVIFSVRVKKQ